MKNLPHGSLRNTSQILQGTGKKPYQEFTTSTGAMSIYQDSSLRSHNASVKASFPRIILSISNTRQNMARLNSGKKLRPFQPVQFTEEHKITLIKNRITRKCN